MHTALTFLVIVAGIWFVIWIVAVLANFAVMLTAARQLGKSLGPSRFPRVEYRTA